MSEVVIRCPNCGTTQSALGECDACHEAETRYFCTNHVPGRWLDGPACSECGARFGVDRARSRPAPPPSPRPVPRPRAEPPAPLGRRTIPIDERERTVEEVWTGPVHTPHRAEVEEIVARDPRVEWPPAPPFPPPFEVRAVPLGGCVRRLVLLFVILLALAALALFGLLGVGSHLLFGTAVEDTRAMSPSPSTSSRSHVTALSVLTDAKASAVSEVSRPTSRTLRRRRTRV